MTIKEKLVISDTSWNLIVSEFEILVYVKMNHVCRVSILLHLQHESSKMDDGFETLGSTILLTLFVSENKSASILHERIQ